MVEILKLLYILKHGDHILHVALAVKDGRPRHNAHSFRAGNELNIPIELQTADTLLFLHDQVKDTDVQIVGKIVNVHGQILVAGNISPVDHHCVDEHKVSLGIIDGDSSINIIQNNRQRQRKRAIPHLRLLAFIHLEPSFLLADSMAEETAVNTHLQAAVFQTAVGWCQSDRSIIVWRGISAQYPSLWFQNLSVEPLIQKGIEVWNFASLFCSFPWSAGYSISQKLCTRVRTCS